MSRRHRGTPPDPPPSRADRAARTLLGAGARCWRAGRAQIAVQVAAALLTGLAPVATAWLLRAILDELAAGHPRHVVELALLLGVTGGIAMLLPSAERYAQAQLTRAITRAGAAELFASVTGIRGLRRLEDPAFQDQLQVAGQVGASAPGQVVSGAIAVLQSAVTLAGFLGTRRQFYASLLTSLAAAKEIRLLGLGRFFRARMLGELAATHQASQQVDRRVLASESGLAAIGALVAVVGLVWAAWQSAAGRLTVGDVSVFVVALGSVSQAVAG